MEKEQPNLAMKIRKSFYVTVAGISGHQRPSQRLSYLVLLWKMLRVVARQRLTELCLAGQFVAGGDS